MCIRDRGYVADAYDGGLYGAMTVQLRPSPLVPGARDRWAVATLDLETGRLVAAALQPQPSIEGAETTSLCGFGILAPTAALD